MLQGFEEFGTHFRFQGGHQADFGQIAQWRRAGLAPGVLEIDRLTASLTPEQPHPTSYRVSGGAIVPLAGNPWLVPYLLGSQPLAITWG
jgi:hypothetical protein